MTSNAKRAMELADEGAAHSRAMHGGSEIHPECAECRRICIDILKAMDITPKQYMDSFKYSKQSKGDQKKFVSKVEAILNFEAAIEKEQEGGSAWDR